MPRPFVRILASGVYQLSAEVQADCPDQFGIRRSASRQGSLLLSNRAVTVQQWVTTSQLTHVGGTRREAVAFAAEHGVAGAVLSDLAIAVSELLTNVVLHGESADNVTISVDVRDDAVTLVVRGAGVGLSPHVKGAAVRMGLVALAAVAENLRICPTPDGGREVSMLLRRTAPAGSVVNGQSPR